MFDRFTSGEDYGFTKTTIPVRLAKYGDEQLISRSQAKRLLARIDKFKVVWFGFDRVVGIGSAFADEVFGSLQMSILICNCMLPEPTRLSNT